MISDLFVAASRLAADVLDVVPPACRREPSTGAFRRVDATGELLLELPAWRPRGAARHFLPSLSVVTDASYTARFELSVARGREWSSWVGTVTLGPGRFTALPEAADRRGTTAEAACDVDVYRTALAVDAVRLRVRLAGPDPEALAAAPWIATLSACDLDPLTAEEAPGSPARRTDDVGRPAVSLPIPARSQLDGPADIARRICSPTSVAMVLDYWGLATSLPELAADVFHPATDLYGIWPAAIRAAGRRGLLGYLLRFPGWSSAAWCLARGLPVVASIGYAAGELTGAALPETTGHLVVITGQDGSEVLVNDPVGATASEVARRYRLDEFERAWLGRSGVGYVLFHPGLHRAPEARSWTSSS